MKTKGWLISGKRTIVSNHFVPKDCCKPHTYLNVSYITALEWFIKFIFKLLTCYQLCLLPTWQFCWSREQNTSFRVHADLGSFQDWQLYSGAEQYNDRQLDFSRRRHVIESNPTHPESTTITWYYVQDATKLDALDDCLWQYHHHHYIVYRTRWLLGRLEKPLHSFYIFSPLPHCLCAVTRLGIPSNKTKDVLYELRFTSLAVDNSPLCDWCFFPIIRRWHKDRCHKTHHQCGSHASWLPSFETQKLEYTFPHPSWR